MSGPERFRTTALALAGTSLLALLFVLHGAGTGIFAYVFVGLMVGGTACALIAMVMPGPMRRAVLYRRIGAFVLAGSLRVLAAGVGYLAVSELYGQLRAMNDTDRRYGVESSRRSGSWRPAPSALPKSTRPTGDDRFPVD